jgi:D-psicose/D-tagatose/L-ribulose 3-epimerase
MQDVPQIGNGRASSRFGAHVYLWAADASTAELDKAIGEAARLGLDFVQVSLSSRALDLVAVKESLSRHEIECLTGLAVPGPVWSDRRRGALGRYLRWAVDATAKLGATMLSGALYTPMGERSEPERRREELHLIRRELKDVARFAADRSITLGLEPLNRYETSLINTCAQVRELLDEIDEPNLLVHLDTFHMNIEEQDLYDAFMLANEQLGYVQLAESDRGTPGDGHLPWEAVFRALRDLGYAGPLAFESFTVRNTALAGAACVWRDVVGDGTSFVLRGWKRLSAVAARVGYELPGRLREHR